MSTQAPAQLERPLHGEDGWRLVDYEFNEATGSAACTYERREKAPEGGSVTQTVVVDRLQFVSEEFHERVRDEQRRAARRQLERPAQ